MCPSMIKLFFSADRIHLRGFPVTAAWPPREHPLFPAEGASKEPIGGDTYYFSYAEYSLPIIQSDKERGVGLRFAMFYDIGNVMVSPYTYDFSHYLDNWGLGIRLNLPIGPLRLDYGIPIRHDQRSTAAPDSSSSTWATRVRSNL